MPSPALSKTAPRHCESGAACPGWFRLGWSQCRACVCSQQLLVTQEGCCQLSDQRGVPGDPQPMHDNKCPLGAGLAHGKGSAITCLVGVLEANKAVAWAMASSCLLGTLDKLLSLLFSTLSLLLRWKSLPTPL